MAASTKSRQRKSLCEESMLFILNLLKLSSLSLARNTLSAAGDPPTPHSDGCRAPEGASQLSYVMLPTSTVVIHRGTRGGGRRKGAMDGGDGKFAEYIQRFHEKTDNEVQNAMVEGRAADYIKRFHEKNRNDSNNESKRLPYDALPPHLHLS